MVRKETLVQVAVVALSIAFAAICLAVWLSRGNAKCIRAKLRLGALLLNLNGLIAATAGCPLIMTCYEAVQADWLEIVDPEPVHSNATGEREIAVNLGQRTDLQGVINDRRSDTFSYRICERQPVLDQAGNPIASEVDQDACADAASIVAQDDLAAADGAFDEFQEEFAIELDPALPAGDYTLELWVLPAADVLVTSRTANLYRLTISDIVKPLPK